MIPWFWLGCLPVEEEGAPVPAMEALGWREHLPPETLAIFVVVFLVSLGVDLFQHRGKEITLPNAAAWTGLWIATALGFCGWLAWRHGADHPDWAPLFLTGYVLELTLSVDNLVVFIAIFRAFGVRSALQHRILHYGILGAIVFRLIFVLLGTGLLAVAGPWAEALFAVFVAWAGVQMLARRDADPTNDPDYESMLIVRGFRRLYPVFPRMVGERFFLDRTEAEHAAGGDSTIRLHPVAGRFMTPAFMCLLVVEGTDVLFAVDSVPAVIAVTQEPLIVYTAMMFAVLGLRSLYFVVEALTRTLVHLEKAVIAVLFFIALKMALSAAEHGLRWSPPFDLTPNASMAIVLGMLACGVIASLVWPERDRSEA
jgi:tellurite resistance protein TerC